MKPFQIILLVVCGLLALSGLFVFATSKGLGGAPQEIGPVTIWGTLPEEGMEAALTELKYDPRYDGVSYKEVDESSFGTALASAIAEGRGPDLLILTQEQLLSESAKLSPVPFEVLPERTFIDTYVPMSELFLGNSGTYGIPFVIDPLVLYYAKDALLSAGVAGAPSTWDGVTALAERLSRVSENRQVVLESAIPFGDYANVMNARAILSVLLMQAGTPITSSQNGSTFSALASRTANEVLVAESAVSFYAQFANPAKTVYSWNRSMPSSRAAFLAGQLAMYPGFASERPYLTAANPNLSFDMARIPQPAATQTRMTYAKLYASAIPRSSANPTGALDVAFSLGSARPSAAAATAFSMAPALRSLVVAPANDRYAAVYYPEALIADGWLSPAPSVTDGIFAGMITNVTSGRSEVDQAIRDADESLDASL